MANNMYTNVFLRKLNESIDEQPNDAAFDAGEQVPPPSPGITDDGSGEKAVHDSMGGDAFNDLRSYLDSLPQSGEVTNQQVIDLGRKYADYFEEVKGTIEDLQEKQLSNVFEDCLNVKFLPLTKALSNMIDELKAGVSDKVHEKNVKSAKENGAKI